ncbi:MAG: heavy metal translocating P-type ATPase [Thiotrichaceae bacterium]
MSQACFHCGLPVPEDVHLTVSIEGNARDMCCVGCEAVANAIVQNGLTHFYTYRTKNSDKPQDLIPEELKVYDNDQLQKSFVRSANKKGEEAINDAREASLILEGIVCAACVWLNERHVMQLAGVLEFRVNFTTHRATLRWDNHVVKLSEVLQAIANIGYNAHPFDPSRLEAIQKKERAKSLRRIAIAGVGMMQVMMLAVSLYLGDSMGMDANTQKFLRWISLLLTTPVVFFASSAFFISAWRDLKRKHLGMDVPVSIAILGAYLASVWATVSGTGEVYFDSVNMFTFFLLVGRFLEMEARHKSGQVAEALVRLLPDTATRLVKGKQQVIPANELVLGDTVLIKPGEVIPADGVVLEGASSVNESLLTGESMPLDKSTGSQLMGGTVNVESPLTMQVEKQGEATVLSAIVRLLDQAQAEKPDIAKFADKVASWFVVVLLIIALAVFAFWAMQVTLDRAFWITLSVLVVTCPCALSLATPVAATAATGELTKKGVLTTRGHALETLAKVDHVVFDKTGTLTHGQLHVENYHVSGLLSETGSLQLAASLESVSEHPVAKAINQLADGILPIDRVKIESGRGVEAFFEGVLYRIGNYNYVQELVKGLDKEAKHSLSNAPEISGTAVYLVTQTGWVACFSLRDTLRTEAAGAIKALHELGIATSILSGDAPAVVDDVAAELGIDRSYGGLLPDEKLEKLSELQQQGYVIAMVGDGVNDAPVLAKAQVSVAMGKGSQLAQASADMVLLSENIQHLPEAILVTRKMQRIIKQNFFWAIVYNLFAVPLAAAGFVAPWMAAIGMSASSLVVVLNSLRLKSK